MRWRCRGEATATSVVPRSWPCIGDAKAAVGARQLAAMALGHLGDLGARHWSEVLARAIDYRSGTPVLLGLPNGVLRLP